MGRSAEADAEARFRELAEPHRGEIQLHCYRMLGSFHDAEDAVQETFLRAWRGFAGFEGRASFRTWLYRIATNLCLSARRVRVRRVMPGSLGAAVDHSPLGPSDVDTAWLEPYPDARLAGIAAPGPGPDARYELRESVQLAFIAALQRLAPRQRAVLLLRDVLGWSAAETAALLDTSSAAVNSALQRARATLEARPGETAAEVIPDDRRRQLLERYVSTWESADIDGFVALLREDAVWTMPPWRQWYVGRAPIRAFLSWVWGPDRPRRQLLLPTAANGAPAFGYYRRTRDGTEWQAFAIQVVSLHHDAVAAIANFVDAQLFDAFGLPATLPVAQELPTADR